MYKRELREGERQRLIERQKVTERERDRRVNQEENDQDPKEKNKV